MRVVIVDPSYASPVGHHQELNGALLAALTAAGHSVEIWADEALAEASGLRRVSCGSGYVDPRHWADLAGSLHLAARLRRQFEATLATDAAAGIPEPAVWLAHGLLPFQQIALAQLLQYQPPARVLVSLMFAPGETLSGMAGPDPTRLRQQAGTISRTAHQALVQAAWPWWPRGTFGHMMGLLLVAMDGRCTRTSVTEHQPTARLNFLARCKQPARGAAAPHPVRRATRRPSGHS